MLSGKFGHSRYLTWLRRYDGKLEMPTVQEPTFLGCPGGGSGNLNVYRRGRVGGFVVFEKIYDSHSEHLSRTLWFHQTVLPKLEGVIKTPRILDVAQGEKITAVYFEYVEGTAVKPVDLIPRVLHFCASTTDLSDAMAGQRFDFGFQDNSLYRDGVGMLIQLLRSAGRSASLISTLESYLLRPAVQKKFAHADLSPSNVWEDGTILDFDQCGFYPDGYDLSRALGTAQVQGFSTPDELESLVTQRMPSASLDSIVAHFYFTSVFRARSIKRTGWSAKSVLTLFDRAIELTQGSKD